MVWQQNKKIPNGRAGARAITGATFLSLMNGAWA